MLPRKLPVQVGQSSQGRSGGGSWRTWGVAGKQGEQPRVRAALPALVAFGMTVCLQIQSVGHGRNEVTSLRLDVLTGEVEVTEFKFAGKVINKTGRGIYIKQINSVLPDTGSAL